MTPPFTNDQLRNALEKAIQELPENCCVTMVVSCEEIPGKVYHNRISNVDDRFSKLQLNTSLKVLEHRKKFGRNNSN